ncbi:hypothetical protein [Burkholderia gladioli]|uniref:hypothetical protein n=1 Tax=Burkholderia gladioli TaxID=28095 RepID=UPI001641B04B|nr:hypothetical protein [Burkholderia gladioli]
MAAEIPQHRAFAAERLERAFGAAHHGRQRLLAAGRAIGGLRQHRQAAHEGLRCRRRERRGVDHHEILRGMCLAARQAFAVDLGDLQRQAARRRYRVVQHVAGVGRQAQRHGIAAATREHAMRQRRRKLAVHRQFAFQQAVALGAHRMRVVARGGGLDVLEGGKQLPGGVGLVVGDPLEHRVEWQGLDAQLGHVHLDSGGSA